MDQVSAPRRLSPSAIDRYRECPRRFRWQDIERLEGEFQLTPELAVGNAVHKVLELAFRLTPDQRDAPALSRLLAAVWPKHWKNRVLGDAGEEAARADAERLLTSFGSAFDLAASPLKLEQWVRLKLPAIGLEVNTRLDRIDRGASGLRVIDYKTGRHQADAQDLPRDTAAMIHALAVSQLAHEPVERVSHYYLRSGEEIYWEPEPEDFEAVAARVQTVLKQILGDRTFEATPGGACHRCPFALRCDAKPSSATLDALLTEENLDKAA
jgi:RecB family exonuclease